tara:strand:- start:1150 stop:1956 length:807 start_codon:yes stop_codon:yes gene_type:complete
MKMKTAFISYIFGNDHAVVNFGTFKMMASFKRFHPNIPLYMLTEKEINKEVQTVTPMSMAYLNPLLTRTIADDYDLVVHIDTDVIVTDRLDEILKGDYDVAVARNNADQRTAGCGTPHCLNGQVDVFKYANAGIVASTKKEFWDDWVELNQKNFNKYPMHEQDNLNVLINSGKYKIKWLDPVDKPVYYNIASAYGDPKWNGQWDKHWESWERIELKDGKLWLDGKLIKMLHYAGGNTPDKFNLTKHFSDEVTEHIKTLCNIPKKFAGE